MLGWPMGNVRWDKQNAKVVHDDSALRYVSIERLDLALGGAYWAYLRVLLKVARKDVEVGQAHRPCLQRGEVARYHGE